MKHIEVAAAVIRRGNEVFATQRGYGEFKDWWEFPGGKIEPGESPQQALEREIHEAAAWLTKDKLFSVRWLPADEGILKVIEQEINLRSNP